MNFKVCVCLLSISCIALGDWRFQRDDWRIQRDDWRIQRDWRFQRATNYGHPAVRIPPYYSYSNNAQSYYKPSSSKIGAESGPNGNPAVKHGGTGISNVAGECAPGIPKCAPRLGRSMER